MSLLVCVEIVFATLQTYTNINVSKMSLDSSPPSPLARAKVVFLTTNAAPVIDAASAPTEAATAPRASASAPAEL